MTNIINMDVIATIMIGQIGLLELILFWEIWMV